MSLNIYDINNINNLVFKNKPLHLHEVKNILNKLNLSSSGNVHILNSRLKQYYIKKIYKKCINFSNKLYKNLVIVSYSRQGRREYMEDKIVIKKTNQHIYAAVYDGHGGKECANYLTKMLYKNILFYKKKNTNMFRILNNAFNKTDKDFLKLDKKSGSTANTIFIDYKTNLFFIANTGDSRSFLCTKDNYIYPLSIDHKPSNIKEKTRILKLPNSFILNDRINGKLAMSRSFGDKNLKKWIISKPDIFYSYFRNIKFILLATDGLFDVMSNYEISVFILRQLRYKVNKNKIVKNLVNYAINVKNSHDNVSIIILFT